MAFFDLNIPYHESDRHITDKSSMRGRRLKLALKAMELGYTGIAYNRTLKGVMSESDRCAAPLFPLTKLAPSSSSFFASVKFHRDLLNVAVSSPFRQYTRLTVVVDIPSQASGLNAGNPILRSYDVVAVRPMNQNAFDQACLTSEVDIIAIDFSEKLPFRLKQPMVKAAIKRGVYFEITYSSLIADVQSRRQMISNCKLLVDWTRGKNLIVCSAAPSTTELRGPQDVANLFSLLGLSRERAKAAISKNCRSLLANALRKKHFYKEAVKVEQIPSGQGNPVQSAFDDWLKWDPISSGDGDLLLDDMEKSFAISKTVKENLKTPNFASNVNGLPAHGLQIKDLISVTEAVLEPPDTDNGAVAVMETETDAAVENPEDLAGLNHLHIEQCSVTENNCSLNNLSNNRGVDLLPEGLMSSTGAKDTHLTSGRQDSEILLDYVPKAPVAVPLLTVHSQACIGDAKIGYKISVLEDSVRLSLPTYNDETTNSEDALQISDEKLNYSNGLESNLVTSVTQSQDIPSHVHSLPDGRGVHITKPNTFCTDNHVSQELYNPLAISESTSTASPLETNVENQFDIDVCGDEGVAVDKVPEKIDIENIQGKLLSSSYASSQAVYMEEQYSKMVESSFKLGDGLPIEGFSNLKKNSSAPIKDDMMGEQMHLDSVINYKNLGKSQAGRQKRKRSSPHQPLLFPFKRFLKPKPFKKKSHKS